MFRSKKSYGQHFLNNPETAYKIVKSLTGHKGYKNVLEIGPGKGILSNKLLKEDKWKLKFIEKDEEAIDYLRNHLPEIVPYLLNEDFLKCDLKKFVDSPFAVIGNFPYNISSQILFKIIQNKDRIPEVIGMFQKEVADRIISSPQSKNYGILSVHVQTWYDCETIVKLKPRSFTPPPKVNSAVIHFKRNERKTLPVN
ncbi:MAG: 16S rRNA (adenine(1518)-N(6)/adenine(1519)-N(6))-dimethyltransferase RsmA, partial [Flavobacteriales bacterium]